MAVDLKRFERIKNALETAKSASSKAEGAIETHMKKLKTDYGVSTLVAARKKAKELHDTAHAAEKELLHGIDQFEERWADSLGDATDRDQRTQGESQSRPAIARRRQD